MHKFWAISFKTQKSSALVMFSGPLDIPSRGNENCGAWKTSIQSGSANLGSRTTFHLYRRWYRLRHRIPFNHRKTGIRIKSFHRKYVLHIFVLFFLYYLFFLNLFFLFHFTNELHLFQEFQKNHYYYFKP